MNNIPQTRVDEWEVFASEVRAHILKYANTQYGEKGPAGQEGSDQASNFSIQDCIVQIKKYLNR